MSDILYPVGYGTEMVTMTELQRRHAAHMHPEYARRLWAWLAAGKGLIGIGGGYRPLGTQPDRPGFAPEGKSFHQPQQYRNFPGTYAAVDLVVVSNPGGRHRAPRWTEVPARRSVEANRWGLHVPFSTESWHMQAVEMLGWQSWRLAGRKDPVAGYPIPARPRVFAPKPTLKVRAVGQIGNDKGEVIALQNQCNFWGWTDAAGRPLSADGNFGALTAQAVQAMQRTFKLAADGVYGPRTAARLQSHLDVMCCS